ncbi:MAG: extracellular solute-binding protein [Lachnospiraceae bacterium]|nr:extracellular solute-binding protein [Lachnospiraceae bacterium]
MVKIISAITVHLLALILLLYWFGKPAQTAQEDFGFEPILTKFTGELEANVTLRVLENDTAIKQGFFEELLQAFNEEYAEYGIVAVDANMDQYLDLENDGPYGFGPDVLYQANDQIMKYTDGQHIQPLPIRELNCYPYLDENAWQAYTGTDGQIYGIPVNIQAPVLYYRKDLLPANWETEWDKNNNGIPDMIENWTDMYAYSMQIREESLGSRYGYMKSLWDVYFASGYLFSYGGYVFGDNGNDAQDIGFAAGESYKGLHVLRQLASIMNEDCIDDTITKIQYAKLASGEFFASMTTPDVYTLYINELVLSYQAEGLSAGEAMEAAYENLITAPVPYLPASGDLTDQNSETIPTIMMGGVNGYAISAYTKAPNAALAFADFATSYEMIKRRHELLGIVPARMDNASDAGGLTDIVNANLSEGNIYIMPSIRAVAQIWTPVGTLFADVVKDPFRSLAEQKFISDEQLIEGLLRASTQVYDAIWTLQ